MDEPDPTKPRTRMRGETGDGWTGAGLQPCGETERAQPFAITREHTTMYRSFTMQASTISAVCDAQDGAHPSPRACIVNSPLSSTVTRGTTAWSLSPLPPKEDNTNCLVMSSYPPLSLDREELERYSRQLSLPGFGLKGTPQPEGNWVEARQQGPPSSFPPQLHPSP